MNRSTLTASCRGEGGGGGGGSRGERRRRGRRRGRKKWRGVDGKEEEEDMVYVKKRKLKEKMIGNEGCYAIRKDGSMKD